MNYEAVMIYNTDGDFLGYAIKSDNKLQSTNLWTEAEVPKLKERLTELNLGNDIRKHWPHPQDPEVVALLNDPNFHPIEYADTQVIDQEKSYLVYEKIEKRDMNGERTGSFEDGDLIPEQSYIVYKTIQIPVRPSDIKLRLQQAMETVARKRAS